MVSLVQGFAFGVLESVAMAILEPDLVTIDVGTDALCASVGQRLGATWSAGRIRLGSIAAVDTTATNSGGPWAWIVGVVVAVAVGVTRGRGTSRSRVVGVVVAVVIIVGVGVTRGGRVSRTRIVGVVVVVAVSVTISGRVSGTWTVVAMVVDARALAP